MTFKIRDFAIWAIVAILLVVLFQLFQGSDSIPEDEIPFSAFMENVNSGNIKQVTIAGNVVTGAYADRKATFQSIIPENFNLYPRLEASKVATIVKRPQSSDGFSFIAIIGQLLPLLILMGIWFYLARHVQGGGKAMTFGKSRAKLLESQDKVTFDDVAGIDEARDDLIEIVDFLKDPRKFQQLGGRIPRGVLLVGSPGTGKTLIAKAVAGEAGVPFFTISGSDFVEMFVGVGASRVRDMFEQARKNAPCIIFIDEIDAVGRHRSVGSGMGGGHDEREQTLNQLLVEMDGIEVNKGVIVLAATNRPDVLDQALLRPGRFDRQIFVPHPDISGREKILNVHVRKVPLGPDVDLQIIARGTPGFSGADLMNLVNEAALLAARRNKRIVTMSEFEDAKDKVMMGAERKSMVMSEDEKCMVAYHEAGHAIIALTLSVLDSIHKATIIPRGRALGMVMTLPERDHISVSFEKLLARLVLAFGGREAEIYKFGHQKVTSGAQSDIQGATSMARSMVMEWGMSDKLGRVRYKRNDQDSIYGASLSNNISDQTAQLIDEEVRRLITDAEEHARKIIHDQSEHFELIAQSLIEFETLSGDELRDLMHGKKPARKASDPPSIVSRSTAVPAVDGDP